MNEPAHSGQPAHKAFQLHLSFHAFCLAEHHFLHMAVRTFSNYSNHAIIGNQSKMYVRVDVVTVEVVAVEVVAAEIVARYSKAKGSSFNLRITMLKANSNLFRLGN